MFDFLVHQVQGIVDILMILETKLDGSFPLGKFLLDGTAFLHVLTELELVVVFHYLSERTYYRNE